MGGQLVTTAVPDYGYLAPVRGRTGARPWRRRAATLDGGHRGVEAAGEPYPLAYAWLRWPRSTAMAGSRSAAARAATQARVTAGRIGADPIGAKVRAGPRRGDPDGLPGGDAIAAAAWRTGWPIRTHEP